MRSDFLVPDRFSGLVLQQNGVTMIQNTNRISSGLISMDDYNSSEFRSWFNHLLNLGGLYLGPESLVSEPGSYFISASTDGAHFLLRGQDNKLRAFLNVCRHREKQILVPKGDNLVDRTGVLTSGLVSCSGHDWQYATDGTHVSPKAFMLQGKTCAIEGNHNLHEVPIESIGGLVWTGTPDQLMAIRELLETPLLKTLGITRFVPENFRIREIWVSPDTFRPDTGMEVFGDISHLLAPGVHGGTLMRFVDPNGLQLDAPENGCGNVQMVPFLVDTELEKMTPAWREYRVGMLEHSGKEAQPFGAVWIGHYPDGTTVEYFPHAVVVSRFAPNFITNGTRNVVEFYFSDEVLGFNPDLAIRFTVAYKGLAHEDAELCTEMDRGSQFLSTFGKGELKSGPAHPTEEWAVSHYEAWLYELWKTYKRSQKRTGLQYVPGITPSGEQFDVWSKSRSR